MRFSSQADEARGAARGGGRDTDGDPPALVELAYGFILKRLFAGDASETCGPPAPTREEEGEEEEPRQRKREGADADVRKVSRPEFIHILYCSIWV